MQAFLAILPTLLEIILYILKSGSKTKAEVIQEIWANRKVKRDEAIVNNQNDKITIDASDIVDGIDGLRKKDSSNPAK